MEDLIELLFDILIDGGIEISKNKKVPKWIRYPIIFLIGTLFVAVTIGIFVLGVLMYKESIWVSIFLIILSFIFMIGGIVKFNKERIERKKIV